MKYREITPPKHLQHVIRFFWIAEADADSAESVAFRIVADGCPGIIFQQSNSRYAHGAVISEPLPNLFLYGQTTRHGILCSFGKTYTIGVNLYSYALKTIFGYDADEFMDEIVDLDLVQPDLYERLCYAWKTKGKIELLCSFLTEQIAQNTFVDDKPVMSSIRQINESRGNIPIQSIHSELQLSERQFQRRFKQQVGVTPKLFSRIIRFQSALQQVRSHQYQQLSDVAFDNGYADQSHFIRDFNEFAGLNPGAYDKGDVSFICRHREWNMAFS
ncbi:helix-turn-helix domain-containing protein [Aliifodinibius sp. S!AR15-10]|uniref:AraC family transcriptional regulator n=1 Tax=Aliifodinibius sp. S!AR15-10 TaxID=2950437 RepID=UPI00285B3D15|nr:helix-turn-helix domain-containing protein [Aliifodinibius sp. S!AR15-10]MDR8393777.1 helix-turn-helix domain-containing protein [Aliifodinibius sp. S!AR15-10]